MPLTTEKTVRELALENSAATRVFEKLGIDYCCGGNQTLEQACRAANLPMEQVLDSLEAAQRAPQPGANDNDNDRDWRRESLTDLIAHITRTHHKFVREEIARLGPLFQKVCGVHGKNHPELPRMQATFADLAQELTMHLMKEEMVLFPYVIRMEEAVIQKEPVLPPPFGTVQNPVSMMMHEHDSAGIALRVLRQASTGYTPPPEACASYQALYRALAEFEADLHQHIHLENNILFPRAIEMEGRH
ncbi:MAG TPA: iron-sulfur cluster repair di-iron protein [Candidatus Sulfotelmatobacter sp.]|nr:iron-sulfur cluster repair di-iron protein [Candidatus Sulfotelmatobacter sp.]